MVSPLFFRAGKMRKFLAVLFDFEISFSEHLLECLLNRICTNQKRTLCDRSKVCRSGVFAGVSACINLSEICLPIASGVFALRNVYGLVEDRAGLFNIESISH